MSRRWIGVLSLSLPLLLVCLAVPAQAQDPKTCVMLMLPSKAQPAAVAQLGARLKAVCAARPVAGTDLARQVRDLRQQGFKRVVLVGHGTGANAALTYAGSSGDAEGVVALGGDAGGEGGDLPTVAAALRQHMPLLWVVGTQDPLHARGEAYAFAKAPPHPASRYVSVKADAAGTPEAAAKAVTDWLRELP